jgi:hypothetical protein
MRLVWKGDDLKRDMRRACMLAIDQTMAECVAESKDDHPVFPPASEPFTPWADRTGNLTGSVRIFEAAHVSGPSTVTGSWGSHVRYSLFIEIGTSREGPTATERMEAADGDPDLVAPEIGPLMARRHQMVPVSDRQYPELPRRIAEAFNAI